MMIPMHRRSQQTETPRGLLPSLAALIAALAAILGITTASASAAVEAEIRIGAISVSGEPAVEPPQHVPAGQGRDAGQTSHQIVVATGVAAEVGSSKATVTAGYGRDGRVVAGCNRNPVGCAEDDVARQIGGDPKDITFTEP